MCGGARVRRTVTWLLAAIAVTYIAALLALFVLQERLIYPIPPVRTDIPAGFSEVTYTTADELVLRAGYREAGPDKPTLLFFHGNGADWQSTEYVTRQLTQAGYGVLAAEYRGYGGNPGSPSEKGFYRDGRAAYDFLRGRGVDASGIVLVGNSIGSGVATHLAAEVDARALVLISPFDSLEATAMRKFRWLPVRMLLRDRYDNAGKFGSFDLPILILHGEEDTLIALDQAHRLADVREGVKLETYPGWGHDLVVNPEVQRRVAAFLEGL
jgi:uncharacterized protein